MRHCAYTSMHFFSSSKIKQCLINILLSKSVGLLIQHDIWSCLECCFSSYSHFETRNSSILNILFFSLLLIEIREQGLCEYQTYLKYEYRAFEWEVNTPWYVSNASEILKFWIYSFHLTFMYLIHCRMLELLA